MGDSHIFYLLVVHWIHLPFIEIVWMKAESAEKMQPSFSNDKIKKMCWKAQ